MARTRLCVLFLVDVATGVVAAGGLAHACRGWLATPIMPVGQMVRSIPARGVHRVAEVATYGLM